MLQHVSYLARATYRQLATAIYKKISETICILKNWSFGYRMCMLLVSLVWELLAADTGLRNQPWLAPAFIIIINLIIILYC